MKAKGNGHIINIASTAGNDVNPEDSVDCSTKAASSIAARHNLVGTRIRVTSISPGIVKYPEDVADQIIYVATRPFNVQVAEIASYCTNQSRFGVEGVPETAKVDETLGSKSLTAKTATFGTS